MTTLLPSGRLQTQMLWVAIKDGQLVLNTETHRKRYRNPANVVAPSTVEDTAVSDRLPEELRSQLADTTPMRRLARPEDVARTVAHFADDDAAFTTGSWAPVNGGLIMP